MARCLQTNVAKRSLQVINRAMHNKWLWRFGMEKNVVWRRLVAAKYVVERNG